MALHDINVCTIINILQNSSYNTTKLFSNENFIVEVERKSSLYYSKCNDDKRTEEEIFGDVLIGEIGEQAILNLCLQGGLKAERNNEELTKEFHWDLMIEGLKVEIKFQGEGLTEEIKHQKWFGFNHERKEGLMFSHWRYYDLIIPFYLKIINETMYVVPWFLIDSSVMDPTNLATILSIFEI